MNLVSIHNGVITCGFWSTIPSRNKLQACVCPRSIINAAPGCILEIQGYSINRLVDLLFANRVSAVWNNMCRPMSIKDATVDDRLFEAMCSLNKASH